MTNANEICPACGKGNLEHVTISRELVWNNINEIVPGFMRSICDTCNETITTPEESRNNKRLVIEFRRNHDGLLSGERIRAFRKERKLSQKIAALIFGGGSVAFSKYENDDVTQSRAMDKLLRVAEAIPDAYNWLVAHSGIGAPEISKINEIEDNSRIKPRAIKADPYTWATYPLEPHKRDPFTSSGYLNVTSHFSSELIVVIPASIDKTKCLTFVDSVVCYEPIKENDEIPPSQIIGC